jgi:parallel beta-helix repeat protein
MRKIIFIILLLVLISGCVQQKSEPMVLTGKSIINQSGTYILTNDISCAELAGESTCIAIYASNLILDCQNHVVLGPGGRIISIGIQISPHDEYVTIKNCNVQKFHIGIRTAHNGLNSIINNTANNNTDIGIYLDNVVNHTLANNTASHNNLGIKLFQKSNNNILINNTATNNLRGIYLVNSSLDNVLIDNYICGNTVDIEEDIERLNAGDIVCDDDSSITDKGNNICLRNSGCENVNCNAGC